MLKVDQCYTYQIKLFTICYSLIPLLSLYIIHLSRTVIYETRDRNYFPRVCPREIYVFLVRDLLYELSHSQLSDITCFNILMYLQNKKKINCLAIKFSKTIALLRNCVVTGYIFCCLKFTREKIHIHFKHAVSIYQHIN